ncbi:MAG TPA: homoserine O-succinyltransferase [Steroidobacteraceae bacterium]|nr:homoserine O-succinyltransferase [Steroidobacteraceae bacterium]
MQSSVETVGRPAPVREQVLVREGVIELPGEVSLHHGGRLPGMRVAWRLAGPANAPVVCALGGISAHRRVCLADDAWWREVAGPGLALDAARWRILGIDYLGGSGETSGPAEDTDWPSVSSYDQADCLVRVLNQLGVKALRGIVGASYGAMVALAFGERYPERVARIVAISGADRPHPLATAWRSVQRQMVRFAGECGRPAEGLRLARALGMSTYRSAEEFAARFDVPPRERDGAFRFAAEDYVLARGDDYALRYRPQSFLRLSESIDLHRIDARRVFVPTTVVAVREDQLVPLADLRALAARLPRAQLTELSSVCGHDAFLKENELLRPILATSLGEHA